GRSPSPISPESRELHIAGIEDDATNSLSWFDRIYETALAQVEAAISARGTPTNEHGSLSRRNSSYNSAKGTPTNENVSLSRRNSYHSNSNGSLSRRNSSHSNSNGSSSRRNSYLVEDNKVIHSSPIEAPTTPNVPARLNTSFSRPPLPLDWLNTQKGTEVET
ncbi:1049_t:CDS:1, partial [Dentiscutata heterogama]